MIQSDILVCYRSIDTWRWILRWFSRRIHIDERLIEFTRTCMASGQAKENRRSQGVRLCHPGICLEIHATLLWNSSVRRRADIRRAATTTTVSTFKEKLTHAPLIGLAPPTLPGHLGRATETGKSSSPLDVKLRVYIITLKRWANKPWSPTSIQTTQSGTAPPEPCSRNQNCNRNHAYLFNCSERQKNWFPRGTAEPKTGTARTDPPPNRNRTEPGPDWPWNIQTCSWRRVSVSTRPERGANRPPDRVAHHTPYKNGPLLSSNCSDICVREVNLARCSLGSRAS